MKLIKLTKQPYGETVYVNPQLISVIEETGDGSNVHIMMSTLVYLVKEAPDRINKMINNTGWSTIYHTNIAQDDAHKTQD